MKKRFLLAFGHLSRGSVHTVALVFVLGVICGSGLPAQAQAGGSAAAWKTHTTNEKEFSVSLPENSTIFRRGEYQTGSFTVSETIEIGAFAPGSAMVVRIFKTNDPSALLQQEAHASYYREARQTEVKGRGVKAQRFVNQKGEVYFEALSLINKGRLYLLQSLARDENNAALQQFLGSVTLKGMTGGTPPPATANNTPPPQPAAPTVTPEPPIEVATASLRPAILYAPKALYNEPARKNRVQGVIVVRAVFTTEGEVTKVQIVRGLPDGLDDEAIQAARRIRFLPAVKNGKPVAVRMTMEFSFNLL